MFNQKRWSAAFGFQSTQYQRNTPKQRVLKMNNVANEIELLEARLRILKAEVAAEKASVVVCAGNYAEPAGDRTGGVVENISGIAEHARQQAGAAFNSAFASARGWWAGAEKQGRGVVEHVVEAARAAYSYCYRGAVAVISAASAAADRVGKAMQITYLRGWKQFKQVVATATSSWADKDLPMAKSASYAALLTIAGGVVAALAGLDVVAQLLLVVGGVMAGFALGVSLALPLSIVLFAIGACAAVVVAAIYFAVDYAISFAEELLAPQATAVVA